MVGTQHVRFLYEFYIPTAKSIQCTLFFLIKKDFIYLDSMNFAAWNNKDKRIISHSLAEIDFL